MKFDWEKGSKQEKNFVDDMFFGNRTYKCKTSGIMTLVDIVFIVLFSLGLRSGDNLIRVTCAFGLFIVIIFFVMFFVSFIVYATDIWDIHNTNYEYKYETITEIVGNSDDGVTMIRLSNGMSATVLLHDELQIGDTVLLIMHPADGIVGAYTPYDNVKEQG